MWINFRWGIIQKRFQNSKYSSKNSIFFVFRFLLRKMSNTGLQLLLDAEKQVLMQFRDYSLAHFFLLAYFFISLHFLKNWNPTLSFPLTVMKINERLFCSFHFLFCYLLFHFFLFFKAQELVAKARKEKLQMMKTAREEAKDEIQKFREEKDAEYKAFIKSVFFLFFLFLLSFVFCLFLIINWNNFFTIFIIVSSIALWRYQRCGSTNEKEDWRWNCRY